MELRPFITKALEDIIGGVQDSQDKIGSSIIVPSLDSQFETIKLGVSCYQAVEFEVTVKAEESKGTETKLNVVAAVVGGHTKAGSGKNDEHSAVLKFKVPVRYKTEFDEEPEQGG